MTVSNPPTPLSPIAAQQARGWRNAALSTAAGFLKVPVDTASFDTTGGLQPANGRWVCQIAGTYQVDGEVNITATASGQSLGIAIYQNGSMVSEGAIVASTGTGGIGASIADVIRCAVGDLIELWAWCSVAALAFSTGSTMNYLGVKG